MPTAPGKFQIHVYQLEGCKPVTLQIWMWAVVHCLGINKNKSTHANLSIQKSEVLFDDDNKIIFPQGNFRILGQSLPKLFCYWLIFEMCFTFHEVVGTVSFVQYLGTPVGFKIAFPRQISLYVLHKIFLTISCLHTIPYYVLVLPTVLKIPEGDLVTIANLVHGTILSLWTQLAMLTRGRPQLFSRMEGLPLRHSLIG